MNTFNTQNNKSRAVKKFNDGFTLVEMIIIVAIIGILVATLSLGFVSAREQSKNKIVRSSLSEMQVALRLYKAQHGVFPPVPSGGCAITSGSIHSSESVNCDPYITGLVPDYISELPSHRDAGTTNCSYWYVVASDGSWYKLTALNCVAGVTSQSDGIQQNDEYARCPVQCPNATNSCNPSNSIFYQSVAVYSKGGECE